MIAKKPASSSPRMHPNLTKGFGMIGPKDFFPLLDFAYMPNNSLTPSLQEQLCRLFPRLKVLAFGAKPESTLHTYFPSFLSRATPSCPAEMKKEVRNLALPQVQLQAASAVDFPCSLQLAPTAICPTQLCFNQHGPERWEGGQ